MSDTRKRNNIITLTSLVAYVLIYFLVIFRFIPNYAEIINGVFIVLLAIISYFMYGYQNCKLNEIRKKVLLEVLVIVGLYFLLIYVLGIFTGYLKNGYSLEILSIIKNVLVPLLSVIALEVFRYIFVSANKDTKEIVSYATMAIILFDIALNFYDIENSLSAIFIFLTVRIIPIIFKNIVLTYLTYQVGYHSCLMYVIPLCIYRFILPSIPNLGNYIYSVVDVVLPTLVYIYASRMITNNLSEKKSKWQFIKIFVIDLLVIILSSIVIILISGIIDYKLIGINTTKLEKVDRGDLVLVHKIKYEDYNKGDLIVYRKDDKVIIDEVAKKENNKIYIIKEYNTDEEDTYEVLQDGIILGKYNNFRISKIAYPTIWFTEAIDGDLYEN